MCMPEWFLKVERKGRLYNKGMHNLKSLIRELVAMLFGNTACSRHAYSKRTSEKENYVPPLLRYLSRVHHDLSTRGYSRSDAVLKCNQRTDHAAIKRSIN